MKKILAALDGLKYSTATRDYAIAVSNMVPSHLVGLFLDDELYSSYKVYDLIVKDGVAVDNLKQFEQKDSDIRATAAEDFSKHCTEKGILFTVRHEGNIAIQELKHESIYADLLIIDSKETLSNKSETKPTRFITELLSDVQSPVLIVPSVYKEIDKVILLYDGEPSSVFATKMFSYVFPELKKLQTEVVYVNTGEQNVNLPDNRLMKEFMERHYPDAIYTLLNGNAEKEIVKYLQEISGNPLVILGAYRRGNVSRWFRESMADVLMKQVNLPLFIAHNK